MSIGIFQILKFLYFKGLQLDTLLALQESTLTFKVSVKPLKYKNFRKTFKIRRGHT